MTPSATSWHAAWVEVVAVATLMVAYLLARARYGMTRARVGVFAVAMALLLVVSVSPLATIALHYLLAAHLLQNVVMAEWAPGLAVLGLGPSVAAAIMRFGPARLLTHPLVALPVWVGSYALWHVPAVYDYALRHDAVLHVEHAVYFVAGAVLWWPVVHDEPWKLSAGAKAVYLFAAFVLASPVGLLLALLPEPIYDFYVDAPRLWGLSPLADQQIAGVVMALSEAIVFFTIFAFFFVRFMAEEEAGYSHRRA